MLNLLHAVNDVLLTAHCTTEPLLPEPSTVEVEMSTESQNHQFQFPAELVKAGGRTFHNEVCKLAKSAVLIIVYLYVGNVIKQTVVIIEVCHRY